MYKDIKIDSAIIYITKLKNNVGSKEITKAIELSNPSATVKNIGIFDKNTTIPDNTVIVLVDSAYNRIDNVTYISKLHEGITVMLLEEFSAYSDEYETKHKKREDSISNGMDYNGLNYQIDETSRLNITGKALSLQLDTTVTSVNWISNTKDSEGNDIVHTFTRDEFIEFAKAVATYYESIILGQIEE